ncbi:peptidoglycan editing factor PgeF [Virgibacillus soli]|uniref:Purine nucleoside phosphorylase n=1 Tax=Paracerasibacillus soli TaxID=480284 RepID=A0ABU5CPD8_9BACI|nr:peptidoglycan editing factor PgeF [Virgibacillus soli]MDY0408110.1 peptidoglycan editing factor PgeF [Virgibacillus soli]
MKLEPFHHSHEMYLNIEKWEQLDTNLKVGFTTRNGGVSAAPFHALNMGLHVKDNPEHVRLNREYLATSLKLPLENWVCGEQIHQTTVHVVKKEDSGKGATDISTTIRNVDGFITKETGILCTAFFADCVPLYFFDPTTSYIGIAHAGWKGSVSRMAEAMVNSFISHGVQVENLQVVIGPCISKDYYEVDHRVVDNIPIQFREKTVTPLRDKHYLLDLKQLNVEILLQCGVLRNNIDITDLCTFRNEDLFYSHRRDGGKTGRMLAYIGYIS